MLGRGLRVESIIAGEEHTASGDTVATVREQAEVDNGTQLAFFFQSRTPTRGTVPPILGWDYPP